MEYYISDLLDGLEEAGQPIEPKGGNAARVKAKTLARLGTGRVTHVSVPVARRRFRPMGLLAAALAAVLLLGGTVFAAWKLGAFSYQEEFGPAGAVLDAHAQSYETEPEDADVIPASAGYAYWIKAELGDYNLTLQMLEVEDGALRARATISAKNENTPAYRDSGLTLCFADYETTSTSRDMGLWLDKVELSAPLDKELAADAEIVFSLTGSDGEQARASFPLNAIEQNTEELEAQAGPRYATAAQTKDYRFTLRSLTASDKIIYAVVDVEARTEWGAAHIDNVPEFAVGNDTHQSSGTLMDARLLSAGEGVRRYLIGEVGSSPVNEVADTISFSLLELYEEGDMRGHPYHLFDVKLESLVSGAILLCEPEGEPTYNVTWNSVNTDPVGMLIVGLLEGKRYESAWPTVELVFKDGSRETVVYPEWRVKEEPASPHEALLVDFTGQHDGTARLSLTFAEPIDPAALAAVVVDGQTFAVD